VSALEKRRIFRGSIRRAVTCAGSGSRGAP
jgi:hypothetical protein